MHRHAISLLLLGQFALLADGPGDLLHWLDQMAQGQLDARDAAIAAIGSKAEAVRRQAFVRTKVLELLGGLPNYEGPLNARITGHIDNPAFVIEKIVFESLPHLYVTANLYRPNRAGRFPGILLPLGHWEYGKPAVQRIAGNLASKGFVVLAYDPLGQGERQQLYDRRYQGSLAGQATEQHLLAGALSELLGQSFARYRIWDAKRALDYLLSRSEVLPEKIGCTGCSGGGTITTYISALDPRIKVAAPACYITSFHELFRGSVGDSEQSLPRFISSGLDLADYIELAAPKPWLISSTRDDFFPLAGAQRAYEEARRWYGMLGAEDRIKMAVGPGGHGTPLEIREAIYDWMIHWLRGGDGSAQEVDVPILPEFDLRATKSGQVADLPGSRDVFDVLRDNYLTSHAPRPKAELIELLRGLVNPPSQAPSLQFDGTRFTFETEPGLRIRGRLLAPAGSGHHPAVLLVESRSDNPERAARLVQEGNVVMTLLPRGLPAEEDPRHYSGDWLPNVRAWLVGGDLPAMRARDILNAVAIFAAREDVDPNQIRAEASGIPGAWLLLAAALDPRIRSVSLDHTPASFRQAFHDPLTRDLHSAVIPGFALHWDLDDLVEPDRVTWTDPTDWLGHVVPLGKRYRYSPAGQ